MPFTIFVSILLIITTAAFIKSAFGFGDGMVNMALLTQLIGLEQAAPLVILLSLLVSSYILIRNRKLIDWKNVLPLMLSAIIFAPLGIKILDWTDPYIMRKILGAFIVLFAVYKLFKPSLGTLKSKKWSVLFGGIGGITGGAYSIAGPPAVIYATLIQWSPSTFRASVQAYFVPLGTVVVLGRTYSGDYNMEILELVLWAIPALLTGVFLGKWLNQSIKNPKQFNKYIYSLLIILGTSLLVN